MSTCGGSDGDAVSSSRPARQLIPGNQFTDLLRGSSTTGLNKRSMPKPTTGTTTHRRRGEPSLQRDERGAIAVWMSVSLLAVIVILGIAVDFSGHARATADAQGVAAEAARAGGQYLRLSGSRATPDMSASVAAANTYVASSPFTGITSVDGDRLRVEVTGTYQTQFLSIIGINELRVQGTGTAEVISTYGGTDR